LSHSDPDGFEPLGFFVYRHEKVVKVHHGVDAIVHGAKNNARGRIMDVPKPAKEQDRDVVVPM
jgi:hypothetical protein